jgi:hypothetical protein
MIDPNGYDIGAYQPQGIRDLEERLRVFRFDLGALIGDKDVRDERIVQARLYDVDKKAHAYLLRNCHGFLAVLPLAQVEANFTVL